MFTGKINNDTLAQRFAEGATEGQGSNMFIKDDTIYSYGNHYRIAIRLNPDQKFATNVSYVYNPDRYSATTNKHQAHVRSAIGSNYIAIPDCNIDEEYLRGYIQELRDDLEKEVTRLRDLQARFKSQNKINYYNSKIASTEREMTARIKEVEFFTTALYGGQAIHFIKEAA